MFVALSRFLDFALDRVKLDPVSAPATIRIIGVRQALKNTRVHWSASLLCHVLLNASIALSGAPIWAFLICLVSIAFDAHIKGFSNNWLNRMRALKDPTLLLKAAQQAENQLILTLIARSSLAWVPSIVIVSAGGHSGMSYAAAAIMLAASTNVFVAQTNSRLRVMVLGTWPIWIGLVAFGLQLALQPEGVILAFVTAAYCCSMFWFARYLSQGQAKMQALLVEKDSHAQQLANALERRKRDSYMFDLLESDLPIGFFDFDARSGSLFWSPGTFRAYGRQPGTAVPTTHEQLLQVAADCREQAKKDILRVNQNAGVHKFVLPIVGMDGVTRQVTSIVHTVLNEQGDLVQIFGMVDDQTELRTLLTRAEQLEHRLETALLSGSSMVWDLEQPGHKIIGFGAVEHYLRPDQDVNGDLAAYFTENIIEEDRELVNQVTRKAYLEKRPQTVDFRFTLDGVNIRHGRSIVTVFGRPSSGSGTIRSFVTDITDDMARREALDQARANAELANNAKSAFLANMSHEIRTPLNGIVAIAGAMAQSQLTDAQREMVNLVRESGVSLERVLNDILDLARVESGRLEIEATPFRLSDLISGTSALFAVRADNKGLKFSQPCLESDPTWLVGDAVRIRQILANFLANAIKFTADGSVKLAVDMAPDQNSEGQAMRLIIAVSDTGPGIEPQDLARLFNRFEQIDASITRAHGGSGLGLAICQSLAQLMGGTVSAESVVGVGSTFRLELTLPVAAVPGAMATPACDVSRDIEADAPSDRLRILAVDDHPTNRRVLQLILEPLGVDLTLCEDGQQALNAVEQADFDLVLMDLQMPVMDGLTATRAIREKEVAQQCARMPIIALSANAMTHHKVEALEAGADLHIAKPFTPEVLISGIREALAMVEQAPAAALGPPNDALEA
jgi:signal transduction histidine kinase/ActR/RegA family two-component response regulator